MLFPGVQEDANIRNIYFGFSYIPEYIVYAHDLLGKIWEAFKTHSHMYYIVFEFGKGCYNGAKVFWLFVHFKI